MLNIRTSRVFTITMTAAVVAMALAIVAAPMAARANVFTNGEVDSVTLSSTPGNDSFYVAGDVVTVDAAFDRGVRVARKHSAATQRMLIRVNGLDRYANYAGRVDGDDSVHRFSYVVTEDDAGSGLSGLVVLIWLLNPFAFDGGVDVSASQIEAVEIQTVDSAFVAVGTQCEARIETDASAVGSIDVMVSRPYTCDYYAADLSLDGLTLN